MSGYGEPIWEGSTILTRTHDAGYRIHRPEQLTSYSADHKRAKLEDVSKLAFNYRGILLFRNPWEAIFSSWQHLRVKSYRKAIDMTHLESSWGTVNACFLTSLF